MKDTMLDQLASTHLDRAVRIARDTSPHQAVLVRRHPDGSITRHVVDRRGLAHVFRHMTDVAARLRAVAPHERMVVIDDGTSVRLVGIVVYCDAPVSNNSPN